MRMVFTVGFFSSLAACTSILAPSSRIVEEQDSLLRLRAREVGERAWVLVQEDARQPGNMRSGGQFFESHPEISELLENMSKTITEIHFYLSKSMHSYDKETSDVAKFWQDAEVYVNAVEYTEEKLSDFSRFTDALDEKYDRTVERDITKNKSWYTDLLVHVDGLEVPTKNLRKIYTTAYNLKEAGETRVHNNIYNTLAWWLRDLRSQATLLLSLSSDQQDQGIINSAMEMMNNAFSSLRALH